MSSTDKNHIIQLVLGTITVLVCGFLMTGGLQHVMDIFFLDETGYLVRGTKMFGKIPKRWGPLYCTWYRILYGVEGNLVNLFYLNFKLMAIIPATLFFLALTRYSRSVLVSLFVALCFLYAEINFPVFPKVSFFCISIVFTAMIMSSFFEKAFYKWLTFLSAALLLSFARPEFYLSFLIILIIGVVLIGMKRMAFQRQFVLPLLGFLLVAVVLHLGLGNPLMVKLDGHNRSLIAFGEHFAYNYAQWSGSEDYLWLAWEDVVKDEFGEISSVSEGMKSNAGMFWKHIGSNLGNSIKSVLAIFAALIIPVWKIGWIGMILGGMTFLLILYAVIKNTKEVLKAEHGYLLILAIPTLISCILIYPRNHYLVLLVPLIGLLLVCCLNLIAPVFSRAFKMGGIVVLAILFGLFGSHAKDFQFFEIRKEEGVLNNQKAIQIFKEANIPEGVTMLTNEGDFSAFSGKQMNWIVPSRKKHDDFDIFLADTDPDIIYITETIHRNPYYVNDEVWKTFLENYETEGYLKLSLGDNIKEHFLIKRELSTYFKQKIEE